MPILTTTIGAYPKPDYVTVPDWFYNPDTANPTAGWAEAVEALGDSAEEIFARGTRECIEDQVNCGIAIPTDGEIRRENYIHYHCRHLEGFDFEHLTVAELRGGNYRAELPGIVSPIKATHNFLDADYQVAQSFTERPVKITLPGPMTIANTTVDHYYQDPRALGEALADALNFEVKALAAAGCRHIQIDEPLFARQAEQAMDYGLDHLERAFHGCPENVLRTIHMCCGYPDRLDNPDYPKAPTDSYHQLAKALDKSSIQAISIEDAHRHNDLKLLELFQQTQIIFGVIAIAKSHIESIEEVRVRLQAALEHIDQDRLIAAPDCGLGLLGRDLSIKKLSVMCQAAASI